MESIMTQKIRVLIIDDSAVIRKILAEGLRTDPLVEVVGAAENGKVGLKMVEQHSPDLVTLDVEMPVMDGVQTMAELHKRYPRLPVIMVSTLTQRGAVTTLEALGCGATDYVTKPTNNATGASGMFEWLRSELLPKVRGIGRRGQSTGVPRPAVEKPAAVSQVVVNPVSKALVQQQTASPASRQNLFVVKNRVDAVVIGISTGGPNALFELLPKLPGNLPVPVFIVQHMPAIFTQQLAEKLNAVSVLSISEGKQREPVLPGHVYIAPGGQHMVVARDIGGQTLLKINEEAPENSCRPSVDVLFRSAGEVYGRNILAIVMTGMGNDGLKGCELIRKLGGYIAAQDEATSVVWGMPGYVVRAGLPDVVLPLDKISQHITKVVGYERAMF